MRERKLGCVLVAAHSEDVAGPGVDFHVVLADLHVESERAVVVFEVDLSDYAVRRAVVAVVGLAVGLVVGGAVRGVVGVSSVVSRLAVGVVRVSGRVVAGVVVGSLAVRVAGSAAVLSSAVSPSPSLALGLATAALAFAIASSIVMLAWGRRSFPSSRRAASPVGAGLLCAEVNGLDNVIAAAAIARTPTRAATMYSRLVSVICFLLLVYLQLPYRGWMKRP